MANFRVYELWVFVQIALTTQVINACVNGI